MLHVEYKYSPFQLSMHNMSDTSKISYTLNTIQCTAVQFLFGVGQYNRAASSQQSSTTNGITIIRVLYPRKLAHRKARRTACHSLCTHHNVTTHVRIVYYLYSYRGAALVFCFQFHSTRIVNKPPLCRSFGTQRDQLQTNRRVEQTRPPSKSSIPARAAATAAALTQPTSVHPTEPLCRFLAQDTWQLNCAHRKY